MRQTLREKLLFGLITATVAVPAFAGHEDAYEDRGRVTAVTQQFERVNSPRQECRTEYVRESYYEAPQRSLGGAVIGGVAGGLLGSTIGRGNGRVAAAAVGAGVGAIVGDRVDNDRYSNRGRERVETRPVESCVTVDNWQQIPAGYLVNYEYNGRQYSTVTDRDPGRYIPVHVEVRPNGYVTNVTYQENRWNDDDDDRGRGYGYKKYKNKHYDKHHGKHRDRNYW
jgi:uncharacterized protein YcfJ